MTTGRLHKRETTYLLGIAAAAFVLGVVSVFVARSYEATSDVAAVEHQEQSVPLPAGLRKSQQ